MPHLPHATCRLSAFCYAHATPRYAPADFIAASALAPADVSIYFLSNVILPNMPKRFTHRAVLLATEPPEHCREDDI